MMVLARVAQLVVVEGIIPTGQMAGVATGIPIVPTDQIGLAIGLHINRDNIIMIPRAARLGNPEERVANRLAEAITCMWTMAIMTMMILIIGGPRQTNPTFRIGPIGQTDQGIGRIGQTGRVATDQ